MHCSAGLEVAYAEQLTLRAQVEAVPAEPELALPSGGIVVGQRPQAGSRVLAGELVMIWIRTGGGGLARSARSRRGRGRRWAASLGVETVEAWRLFLPAVHHRVDPVDRRMLRRSGHDGARACRGLRWTALALVEPRSGAAPERDVRHSWAGW